MKFFKKLIASFFTKDPRDIAPQEMFQIVGIVNQLPWHPTRK